MKRSQIGEDDDYFLDVVIPKTREINWRVYLIKTQMSIMGISQSELANYCKISQSQVSDLLTNAVCPSFKEERSDFEIKTIKTLTKLKIVLDDLQYLISEKSKRATDIQGIRQRFFKEGLFKDISSNISEDKVKIANIHLGNIDIKKPQ